MAAPAVELVNVTKSFDVVKKAGWLRRVRHTVTAVDNLSLEIDEGAMVGFIGPNGAGKSTTVKLCTGVLVPTTGQVRVTGRDPSRARMEVATRIGVVFGQRSQLWWDLPLVDSLDLLRHVYRVPTDRHAANVAIFTDLLDLGPFLATPVRQLSLGQRMRGELASALLHDPQILFLDEPTIGLDLVSKEAVRGFLRRLNQERGTTVLLTTHDLVDVERLSDRLLIIDNGGIIEDSSVEEIKARYGQERTLVIDLEYPSPALVIVGATVTRVEGPRQWIRFHRDQHSAASLLAAVTALAPVRDLTIEEPAIDDVVSLIYGLGS